MTPLPPAEAFTPEVLEQLRVAATAEIEKQKLAGTWAGGIRAHTEYQDRPLEWIEKYLEIPRETIQWSLSGPEYEEHDWDGDVDPMVTILQALADWNDVACESATGTGKTFLAALVTYWFLACHQDSLVITWAPKQDQLLTKVWKEIGFLWPRFKRHFPNAILLTGKIRMKPEEGGKEKWAATASIAAVGADEEAATKAQGDHAEHMLHIIEETPGMPGPIMVSIDNTCTDDHNLRLGLGNPDHRNDELHRFAFDGHNNPREGVVHVRISAFDHPNIVTGRRVIPGAIGPKRLRQRIEKYGRGSRLYESRIRGISPAESEDALIRWEWCVAAAAKYEDEEYRIGVAALGGDVANSERGDKAAVARWLGACLLEVVSMKCPDANLFGAALAREILLGVPATEADIVPVHGVAPISSWQQQQAASFRHNPPPSVDPRYVGIDPVGVGAGAVNEARRLGVRVRWMGGAQRAVPGIDEDTLWSETETDLEGRIKASGPAVVEAERFLNLRSQVWWRFREDLRLGRAALPMDEELFTDLTTPTYTTKNGRIVVESKEDIFKRLRRSPDKGDAAVYGNFVRRRRPIGAGVRPVEAFERQPNREYGLEKLLARHEKRARAEERQVQRMLRQRARNRRRA